MRRKIVLMVFASLFISVGATLVILTLELQGVTMRSFEEQQTTIQNFASSNFELGLSAGRIQDVKTNLGELQRHSLVEAAVIFDPNNNAILSLPAGYEIRPTLRQKIFNGSGHTENDITYRSSFLRDQNQENLGRLVIAFRQETLLNQTRNATVFASVM